MHLPSDTATSGDKLVILEKMYRLTPIRSHDSIKEEPVLEALCAVLTNDSITSTCPPHPRQKDPNIFPLLSLPVELQCVVLGQLDTFDDLLSMLLVCRSLYPVAKHVRDTQRFEYSLGYVASMTQPEAEAISAKVQADIIARARRPSDVNEHHWGNAPSLGGDVWHWWARLTIPDVRALKSSHVFKTIRRRRISGVMEWPEPECGGHRIPYTEDGFGNRVARAIMAG